MYIVSHCPSGRMYGAGLRTFNIGRVLQQLGDVTLIIASFRSLSDEELAKASELFNVGMVLKLWHRPLRWLRASTQAKLNPRFMNTNASVLLDRKPQTIKQILREHDLVWIHTLRVTNAIGIYKCEKSVIDLDDVMSRYYLEKMKNRRSIWRAMAMANWWVWRNKERRVLERFDIACVCSHEDHQYMGGGKRFHVVPNAFEDCGMLQRHVNAYRRIGFIGLFDYRPNREGIRWFIKKVWPIIRTRVDNAELRLIGKGSNEILVGGYEGITALGWIEDPSQEMQTWCATIVPIFEGAGTRVKIAEALARGIPIVSTRYGAYGYEVVNGREILIADSAEEFAEACISLIVKPELGQKLILRGRELYERKYSLDAMAECVKKAVDECLFNNNKTVKERGQWC